MEQPTAADIKVAVDAIAEEVKGVGETLVPLMKEYLKDIRAIRMSLNSEIHDIIKSSQRFRELV